MNISFLPLAYIFERMVISFNENCIFSGLIRITLMDDILYFEPTLLFTVPRVFTNYSFQKVFDNFNYLLYFQRQLEYMTYNSKKEYYRNIEK